MNHPFEKSSFNREFEEVSTSIILENINDEETTFRRNFEDPTSRGMFRHPSCLVLHEEDRAINDE